MRPTSAVLIVLCLLLTAAFALPAHAAYTGLIIIPTAAVLTPGLYELEGQVNGVSPLLRPETRLLNTELGLNPRLEAGLDFGHTEDASTWALFNAKYLLSAGGDSRPAAALGVYNVGPHSITAPYLVVSQPFPAGHGHLGLERLSGHGRWFAGVDYSASSKLTFMADYTSGQDNESSIGGTYQFTDALGMEAGVIYPNGPEEGTEFLLQFILHEPYRPREESPCTSPKAP